MAEFSFTIKKIDSDSRARRGEIHTRAGVIQTPAFVPVATTGVAKGLDSRDLVEIGSQCAFCNTYHMHLRPGEDVVKNAGGLSKFIAYPRPIFTDSGGFQAFSLGLGKEHGIGKVGFFPEQRVAVKETTVFANATDEGVHFKSIYDGTMEFLTPERSMEIQAALGADIIMAFDECTSPLSDYEYTKKAVERTHKWAVRCLQSYDKNQALYGIIQGGEWEDLRIESTKFIVSQPFDGIAIGGSLGKDKNDMKRVMDYIFPLLDNRPRHMLGIGGVDDIFECVARGIDTMDCVAPTRNGRRGSLYICPQSGGNAANKWRINIDASKFRDDLQPIDPQCDCMVCKQYSRSFLRHLHNTREYTYARLAAYHNVYFITKLFEKIRTAIDNGTFVQLKKEWLGE
ncbi:MAG TPA: tRNA guanosine(34) transglycosylase Tgt [Acidobacteriota bacterium]|nr:tRNA guanosine(34) transglycosylase Tgt [Acidobacteriota bacterium]